MTNALGVVDTSVVPHCFINIYLIFAFWYISDRLRNQSGTINHNPNDFFHLLINVTIINLDAIRV